MIPLGTIASSYNAPGGILILDSFDRADSDTLGFADTGEEWVTVDSGWGIRYNTAYQTMGKNVESYVEVGTVDMRVEITYLQDKNYMTVVARSTGNWATADGYRLTSSGSASSVARRIAGVNEKVWSGVGDILSGDRVSLSTKEEPGGTRVIVLVNGVEKINLLDEAAIRPMGTKVSLVNVSDGNGNGQFDDLRIEGI